MQPKVIHQRFQLFKNTTNHNWDFPYAQTSNNPIGTCQCGRLMLPMTFFTCTSGVMSGIALCGSGTALLRQV